ncbi:DNA-binding XRE family transcriptional regulator [Ancylobacter sp. 3268]|uniref:helix-turn-helix domain-containing protein n=1 Tax=Ancylobacter sp. 3268 TaxID=2817752 RepID=UPI00285EF45B|nr:helix-turn-helix transcriptional regulator [Ancylobacter sp. 3268]MDR6953801.1 DNA-binding XRE family transcriptional regulator [Ancylobacter sp. 3268]
MTAIMTKSPAGEDIVILSRPEYDALVAASEDAADARAAGAVLSRIEAGTEALIADEDMDAYLAAATPLAFWRKKRGLTQAALASATGVGQGFLSEIESGKKTGDVATLKKIANALGLRIDDIVAENE